MNKNKTWKEENVMVELNNNEKRAIIEHFYNHIRLLVEQHMITPIDKEEASRIINLAKHQVGQAIIAKSKELDVPYDDVLIILMEIMNNENSLQNNVSIREENYVLEGMLNELLDSFNEQKEKITGKSEGEER
jgi:Fe2+ or Zn2+ uptake regulation protein